MLKKSAGFLSFIIACLFLVPIVSADEGDIGRPHAKYNEVEQQELE